MHVTGVCNSDYYKFQNPTRDSFPDLTPDDAYELMCAQETLEEELRRDEPGCLVGIVRDHSGYKLIIKTEHPVEVDENFVGWRVVTEELDH